MTVHIKGNLNLKKNVFGIITVFIKVFSSVLSFFGVISVTVMIQVVSLLLA